MTKNIKNFLSILIALCFMSFAADYSVGNTSLTDQNQHIPPDFSSYKDTLLVLDSENSHNLRRGYKEFLKNTFETNYHGPYKLVGSREVYRYPADQYRYIFICS